MQRGLAHAVSRTGTHVCHAGHRTHVDDGCIRVLHQLWVRQSAHLERRKNILLEDLAVFIAAIIQRGQRLVATRIVDQQGEWRTEVGDPVEDRQTLFGLSKVCTKGEYLDLGKIIGQLYHHLFEVIGISRHQQ